jgi:hypothetical protein
MRVYIPATLPMLQELVTDGFMQARAGTAFAVTPALRESYAEGDDEELAEVAIGEAALASLRLLSAEPDGDLPLRRAVVVADAPDDKITLRPDLDDAVVRVSGRLGMDQVAAVYVDNADAEPAVRAAIAVIDEADFGDEDAELTVGDAQDHALAWYATQEVPFLLDLL